MTNVLISSDLSYEQQENWDKFVLNHPNGTFCHLYGYAKVMQKSFGYKPYYALVTEDDKIKALWPMSLHRTLFSAKLISMPVFEFGGPLFDSSFSEEQTSGLLNEMKALLKKEKIGVIQSRVALGELPTPLQSAFHTQFLNDFATLKLGDPEHLYKKVLDYQIRKAVAKAQRNNLTVQERHDGESLKYWFYPLYLKYMKERHGAPPLPLDLFLGFERELGSYLKVFYVKHEGKVIAALLGYATGKRIYISHAPVNFAYHGMRPSDLAHWTFIEWACKKGFEFFDFGNARYAGQKQFKKKWGCEFHPYNRIYFSGEKSFVPSKSLNPSDFKYQLAAKIWRSFVPTRLTPTLGRYIHAYLGE